MMTDLKFRDNGEGLSVSKGGSQSKWKVKFVGFDKSKLKFFICHKIIHLKKDWLEREDDEYFIQIVVTSYEDGYESVSALVMLSLEIEKSWVMDS